MAKGIPPHVQRFLDWLQGEWQIMFRAIHACKEGARFTAFNDGKDREYLVHGIDAGPLASIGFVEEVPKRRP